MVSLQHLRTPMQAIRRAQAEIICRNRRTIKPSAEILQILPDLIEIYNETHLGRSDQRRKKKLHWGRIPHYFNFCSQFGKLQNLTLSAKYNTQAHILPDELQRHDNRIHNETREASSESAFPSIQLSSDGLASCLGHLSLEKEVLARLSSKDDTETLRQKNLERLVNDIQRRKQHKTPVPERVHAMDLDHLLTLQSKSSRGKFLSFLAMKEKLKHRKAEEQLVKRKLKDERTLLEPSELKVRNCFIRRGSSVSVSAASEWNLARGLMFGQPIVFDLSYEALMDRREVINTIMQLGLVIKINKTLRDPFHIHLTNIPKDGTMEHELKRVYRESLHTLMVSISNESPRRVLQYEELVYLTADSPNVLTKYDPVKVYIIGGFVDRRVKSNVSLGKAMEEGIAHARLPLDENLKWHKSTKNLTLDQMVSILSELQVSGNWSSALEHVPKRKHLGSRVFI